jgi:hypothetical protein
MEVGTGGNFYKAYHWPGFASGAAYDEKAVLALTRNKGFEIQGLEPPAIDPPAAPKLLSIGDPAAISWQGSTGASAYDVERAASATGPWTKVGRDVNDADVQYRPLFHDESVAPGETYFYRVIARSSAGDSPPSNVVGPVTPAHRTLVDDCRELDQLAGHQGDVTVATDNVRRTQEDAHRFVLPPGAAIEYRADAPIVGWRIDVFAESPDAELEFAGSADGQQFTPLAGRSEAFSSGEGDYGYLVPIRFQGTVQGGEVTMLRIARPAEASGGDDVQIARVEIQYGE